MNLARFTLSGLVLALVLISSFPKVSRAASQDDPANRIQLHAIQIQQLKVLKNLQKRLRTRKSRVSRRWGWRNSATASPNRCRVISASNTIVSTPDERQDGTLKPEQQKRIDAVKASREKCVVQGFFRKIGK